MWGAVYFTAHEIAETLLVEKNPRGTASILETEYALQTSFFSTWMRWEKSRNVLPSWVVVRNYNKGQNTDHSNEKVFRKEQGEERNKPSSYAGGEMLK